MMQTTRRTLRCAIYTRKSTEHGLEQEFNSLEAQREACEAYVKSQAHEGWRQLPEHYDDGGYSGGSMERPALKRLLADIAAGATDVVVVYKVDRLTRSLADFAKLVELFDVHRVSFVSVTQHFDTTSSMGRLTLNVLLSFAQFEREVTGERIRDKIAASKKKGMRMGGPVPLGYRVESKRLVIDDAEAETVRLIFARYLELGCLTELAADMRQRGITTKMTRRRDGTSRGGVPFSKSSLGFLLRNRVYVGEVIHKGRHYPGEHEPILQRALFDAVQEALTAKANGVGYRWVNRDAPLSGKLLDAHGRPMHATTTKKNGVRYRYYASRAECAGEASRTPAVRVPAPELEAAVREALAGSSAHDVAVDPVQNATAAVAAVRVLADRLEIAILTSDPEEERTTIVAPWARPRARPRRSLIGASNDAPARPIRSETRARLVEGIAKARGWIDDLLQGRCKSTHEIAEREGCSERGVRMALNLAFLSPDIVQAAVEGTLANTTGTSRLASAPASWERQREGV
jgi:site-specific DNA recombinase